MATGAGITAIGLAQFGGFPTPPPLPGVVPDPPKPGKPQTIMLLGTDQRKGADASSREDARADTIILARLDAEGQAIALMSIPRDYEVEFPRYGTDKINSAYARGGADATYRTVKRLLSRPGEPFQINHVVEVSFSGFRELVDYLGCSWVDVDRHYFNDQGGAGGYATIDIEAGYQRLCGTDALAYVRYRHGDNDLVRAARQQDFVRQLLRQPGVKARLDFSQAKPLARIASRYTRTDRSLARTKGVISLLKLALGVKGKPVVQVPFGNGEITDDGSYLVAPDAAIETTVDRFLHPKVAATEAAPKRTSTPRKRAPKRRAANASKTTSGMRDVRETGRTAAIAQQRKLGFDFAYPQLTPAEGRFVGDGPRRYALRAGGRVYRAYRTVIDVSGEAGAGQYLGVQGTNWRDPPILGGSHDRVKVDGRNLEVHYDGRRVALVAWRTRDAVYWVSNTLTRSQPYDRMIATARSLTRLR